MEAKGIRTDKGDLNWWIRATNSMIKKAKDRAAELSGKLYDMNAASRKKSDRMKELKELLRLADDYTRLKPINDGIPPKGGFGEEQRKNKFCFSKFQTHRRRADVP